MRQRHGPTYLEKPVGDDLAILLEYSQNFSTLGEVPRPRVYFDMNSTAYCSCVSWDCLSCKGDSRCCHFDFDFGFGFDFLGRGALGVKQSKALALLQLFGSCSSKLAERISESSEEMYYHIQFIDYTHDQ